MTTLTESRPKLSLIVPVYNEEATIDELRARLLPVLEPLGTFEVILINDGSKDRSAEMLDALCASDPSAPCLTQCLGLLLES